MRGVFTQADKVFEEADKTFDEMDAEINEAAGVCITNNNGHVVITGSVKSLRVNDQVVELKTESKADG